MEFRLPELGEGVYEAELVGWHVKPGDAVQPGQNLVEVLTDKATMEVPAPFAGTIGPLRAEAGATLRLATSYLEYQPPAPPRPPRLSRPVTAAAGAASSKPAARRPDKRPLPFP